MSVISFPNRSGRSAEQADDNNTPPWGEEPFKVAQLPDNPHFRDDQELLHKTAGMRGRADATNGIVLRTIKIFSVIVLFISVTILVNHFSR